MSWTRVSNDVKVCKKCGYVGGEVSMYCEDCGNETVFVVSDCDYEDEYIAEDGLNNIDIILESKRSKY